MAELLADQFTVLGDERPTEPRAFRDGDLLRFTFGWPVIPADEALIASGRLGVVIRLRTEFLEIATPAMAELVNSIYVASS